MIKRNMFSEVKGHLSKKEISFIVGPRQAGKTTLMLILKEYLEKDGKQTLYLNLDIESNKEYFTSQEKLLKKIRLEMGPKRGFVFIDEIQRKEDAGIFLKGIYDMNTPYKFIVSGSGSVELKEKIHESLVGRKQLFELSTLSFEEFVNYKTDCRYEDKLSEFFLLETSKSNLLLEEYLKFGGYPRVTLEDKFSEKLKLLNEIYQSYIERDISYLLKVQKTEAFSNLVKIISSQIGKLTNFSELSSTLGISYKTIKEYLWYLEKTFIINRVPPYFRNVRKEITKSPIFYFYDLGLRNFALNAFEPLQGEGFLFRNFIFNVLRKEIETTSSKICFWRSKNMAEVDFIVNSAKLLIPIEVKYRNLNQPKISRSLRSFIKRYKPGRSYIINLSFDKIVEVSSCKIHFIPFYKIMEKQLKEI
jgi:predicted AAA+ superfamily ATPase